jgi:hypothetical protein
MTLRHRFSSVLPFGSRAILVVSYRNFRPSGFVPPAFAGFALFDSQAVLVFNHFRPFDFASPAFAGFAFSRSATLLLHEDLSISIWPSWF